MKSDLASAVDRVRRVKALPDGDPPSEVYTDAKSDDEANGLLLLDCLTIIDAYLAEHPPAEGA